MGLVVDIVLVGWALVILYPVLCVVGLVIGGR